MRRDAAASPDPASLTDAQQAALGLRASSGSSQTDLKISPLQLALAAAALSADGRIPAPRLALSYRQPDGQWILFPAEQQAHQVLPRGASQAAAELLAVPDLPIWRSLAHLGGGAAGQPGLKAGLTWFVAGTLPTWQGSPLVLVLLFEEDTPELANQLGLEILTSILQTGP